MKQKLALIISAISVLTLTNPKISLAQTKKGVWLAEGNLGNLSFYNNKNVSTSSTYTSRYDNQGCSISLYPRVGYFISDNIAVGASLSLNGQFNNYKSYRSNGIKSSDAKNSWGDVGLIPYLRYYFLGEDSKNKFYGQLGAGMSIQLFSEQESTSYYDTGEKSGSSTNPSNGYSVSGEALIGFNHFFTDNIAFNTAIGYSYKKQTQTSTSHSMYAGITTVFPETKNINEGGNVVWSFGFTMIIPGKSK